MNLRIAALGLVLVFCVKGVAQSYTDYEQPTNNLVETSPSMIGWHGGLELNVTAQKEFAGFNGAPALYGISGNGYIHALRTAIGISQSVNILGSSTTYTTSIAVSPKIRVGQNFVLMPAFSASRPAITFPEYYPIGSGDKKALHSTIIPKLSLGGVYKTYFFSVGYTFGKRTDLLSYSPSVSIQNGINVNLGEVLLTPRVALQFEPPLQYSTPDFLVNLNYFNGNYGLLQLATNAQYRDVILAAKYDLFNEITLGAGYEFLNKIRVSYTIAIPTGNAGNISHGLGVRALLFKDVAKDSFISNIGLLL